MTLSTVLLTSFRYTRAPAAVGTGGGGPVQPRGSPAKLILLAKSMLRRTDAGDRLQLTMTPGTELACC